MRRVLLPLLALAAVLATAPGAAHAKPAPPDPVAPAVRGTPSIVAAGAHRVRLYVRFDRALAHRFDGEPLATAAIDGQIASLEPVPGRAACYEARAWIANAAAGRVVAVSVSAGGAPRTTVSALVAIGAPRAGHARGAPPRC
jgi:hypothetical protein